MQICQILPCESRQNGEEKGCSTKAECDIIAANQLLYHYLWPERSAGIRPLPFGWPIQPNRSADVAE